MKRFSKKLIVTAIVVAGAMGVGVAFAAWTATGTGNGTAKARTAQTVTITAVTPVDCLYPGGPACPASFTLDNTNPYAITFTAWELNGTITTSDEADCPAATYIADQTPAAVSLASPASVTTGTLSISNVVKMDHSAPDDCQGVTVDIPLKLTGSQN